MFNEGTVMVHIKRMHEDAILPAYKSDMAAGFDLSATKHIDIDAGETRLVPLGWAFEIPEGYELQIRPRSGISLSTPLRVILGTVDSDYRGEVSVIVHNTGVNTESISYGERIAQGVLNKVPRVRFLQMTELSSTNRGAGGFGSSGK